MMTFLMLLLPLAGCISGDSPVEARKPPVDDSTEVTNGGGGTDGVGNETLVCIDGWFDINGTCLMPMRDLEYSIPTKLTRNVFHWFEAAWNGSSPQIPTASSGSKAGSSGNGSGFAGNGSAGSDSSGTGSSGDGSVSQAGEPIQAGESGMGGEGEVDFTSRALSCNRSIDESVVSLQANGSIRIFSNQLGEVGPCTVTLDNGAGSSSYDFSLTLIDTAPSGLSYQLPAYIMTTGENYAIPIPAKTGGPVVFWSVAPALPIGLYLLDDGAISGMPFQLSNTTDYVITAANSGGTASANLSLTVVDQQPMNIRWFDMDIILTLNESYMSLPAMNDGGSPLQYEVSPELPNGLALSALDGVISGIPTALVPRTLYHVWGNNSGGVGVALLHITIIDLPISSILYPRAPLDMIWGNDSVDMLPETNGGVPVNWTIFPAPPAGLTFDSLTGGISGGADSLSPWQNYTITAWNSAGFLSANLSIRIADITPLGLDWGSTSFVLTANESVMFVLNNSGPAVDSYSVSPALPDGLLLDSTSGAISGSPIGRTAVAAVAAGGVASRHAWTTHMVWANNSGGGLATTLTFAIHDLDADFAEISLRPVGEVNFGGSWPSLIVPFGEWAFPIGIDYADRPIVSGGHVGQGRMVGYGHETMVARSGDDGRANLSMNSLDWVCDAAAVNAANGGNGGPGSGTGPSVGLHVDYNGWSSVLESAGYTVQQSATPADLSNLDCFVADFWNSYSDADNQLIESWLETGGGLIMGGHAWYWSYSNGDAAHAYPGNKIASASGLMVATASGSATFTVPNASWGPTYRAATAIPLIEAHLNGSAPLSVDEAAAAGKSVRVCTAAVTLDYTSFWTPLRQMSNSSGWVRISSSNTYTLNADAVEDLLLSVQEQLMKQLPAAELFAHPSSSDFPGAVSPTAPRLNRTIALDGNFAGLPSEFGYANARAHGRLSTGLYAAPGDVVNITIPSYLVGQGVYILIGAHTDSLWGKSSLSRHPQITRWWAVDNQNMQVANAFGGPIYIAVPAGSTFGDFNVTIVNAVEMPRYVHGVTNLSDWRLILRHTPAPYAELQSENFILTVPSSVVRNLDDPDYAMDFWDEALPMEHNLSGYTPWPRVERAVFDVQISAGWMHSGYPFMAHTASAAGVVNGTHMYTNGDWGMFHELGHNHQWMSSTLPGNTEATCNLYSVRLMEDLVGLDMGQGHGAMSDSSRTSRTETYFNNGAQISSWSVWTALETYIQIKEEFGWAPVTAALTEYYWNMSSQPSGDSAEFNEWALQISLKTGSDLTPFLSAWGFPLTQNTRDSTAHLPVWTTDPLRGWVFTYDAELQARNASNVTSDAATLHWYVRDNGSNATVTVCSGTSDGGSADSAWGDCRAVGNATVGDGSYALMGLSSGTTYYFRVYAENSNGQFWVESTRSFTTV
jgi:hypothetical protein